MEHATQIALTRRVLDFVDRNSTELAEAVYLNPTATYTCPNQAERERELLFRGHPLFFGLSCELGKPGDWRADDLSGVPVLVCAPPTGGCAPSSTSAGIAAPRSRQAPAPASACSCAPITPSPTISRAG